MEYNKHKDMSQVEKFPNKKIYLENLNIYLENVLTYFERYDNIFTQSHFI